MSYPTAGINGLVQNGANTVANMQKWSVSAKGGTAKTTSFQASGSWEVNTPTIKSWTATCDGFTNPGDTLGQLALFNGLLSTFTLTFEVDSTPHSWSGTGILTGIDPAADAQNMNTVKLTFTGSGPLTFT